MSRLLVKNPTQRLGSLAGRADDIKAHPWFRGFDWKAFTTRKMLPPYVPKVRAQTGHMHGAGGGVRGSAFCEPEAGARPPAGHRPPAGGPPHTKVKACFPIGSLLIPCKELIGTP